MLNEEQPLDKPQASFCRRLPCASRQPIPFPLVTLNFDRFTALELGKLARVLRIRALQEAAGGS